MLFESTRGPGRERGGLYDQIHRPHFASRMFSNPRFSIFARVGLSDNLVQRDASLQSKSLLSFPLRLRLTNHRGLPQQHKSMFYGFVAVLSKYCRSPPLIDCLAQLKATTYNQRFIDKNDNRNREPTMFR